ncbi:MAG TPA: DUF4349 domain-containing protein, partial [Gaiellaceae bacterium]|nr:DUF4349 domain-containing protein [Gaiellaceae bacterium]
PPPAGQAPGAADLGAPIVGPTPGRAQRVSASLTVEVRDPEAVSRAAREALELARRLGGHVLSASVVTGDEGNATLTLRIPAARVQEAVVALSSLGRLASQQVQVDDLQEQLERLRRRARSVRSQVARIAARLESTPLDAETRAVLRARLRTLREELRELRRGIAATNAEARMATVQVAIVTPDALGAAPVPSRLDRALDEALGVLVWEAVVALALLVVAAPLVLAALALWAGRRLYRRREEERLLQRA